MERIGIGVVGAGWMGHAHAAGYRRLPELWPDTDAEVELIAVADVDAAAAAGAARRYGFARVTNDWRDVVADPDVDVVDITGPNDMHADVAIAAARAGKTVACEKPLGRDLAETRAVAAAVSDSGVVSQLGFSYRLVPGVQFARALVSAGDIGDVRHIRCWFLTDFGSDPRTPFSWRYDRDAAGSGSVGDLGTHVVEMAEGLAGPIDAVAGAMECYIAERPDLGRSASHFAGANTAGASMRPVTNDDSFVAAARFASGALGTLEASRVLRGPRAEFGFEVYGTRGAVRWDLERMNELEVHMADGDGARSGFTRVVSGPAHPDFSPLSPGPGVGLSWQDLKTIEAHHLVRRLRGGSAPDAGVALGLRVAEVLDAIERSSEHGHWTAAHGEA